MTTGLRNIASRVAIIILLATVVMVAAAFAQATTTTCKATFTNSPGFITNFTGAGVVPGFEQGKFWALFVLTQNMPQGTQFDATLDDGDGNITSLKSFKSVGARAGIGFGLDVSGLEGKSGTLSVTLTPVCRGDMPGIPSVVSARFALHGLEPDSVPAAHAAYQDVFDPMTIRVPGSYEVGVPAVVFFANLPKPLLEAAVFVRRDEIDLNLRKQQVDRGHDPTRYSPGWYPLTICQGTVALTRCDTTPVRLRRGD